MTLETAKANLSFGRLEFSVKLVLQSVILKVIYSMDFHFAKSKLICILLPRSVTKVADMPKGYDYKLKLNPIEELKPDRYSSRFSNDNNK